MRDLYDYIKIGKEFIGSNPEADMTLMELREIMDDFNKHAKADYSEAIIDLIFNLYIIGVGVGSEAATIGAPTDYE